MIEKSICFLTNEVHWFAPFFTQKKYAWHLTKKGYHNLVSTAKILNFKQGWKDHDIPRSNELNLNQSLKLNDPITQRKAQIVHSTYPIAQLWLTTTLGSLSDTITV